MNEFTTLAYLLSFPGMVAAVILMTQFTKHMFDTLLNKPPTKFIVYGWSLLFCIIAIIILGTFGSAKELMETLLVWLVNSVIVWLAAMKAFELAPTLK